MKRDRNHPSLNETKQRRSNPAGDLPAEFDRRLVELDRELRRSAASQPTPPGLAERVFRASVSLLPHRQEADHAPLRFPRPVRTPVWGQLAVAASVAVAFLVAAWFHSATIPTPTEPDGFVHHTPAPAIESLADERPYEVRPAAHHSALLPPEVERLLFDGRGEYLLDTRDLTHAELIDDLHRVYEDLSEL